MPESAGTGLGESSRSGPVVRGVVRSEPPPQRRAAAAGLMLTSACAHPAQVAASAEVHPSSVVERGAVLHEVGLAPPQAASRRCSLRAPGTGLTGRRAARGPSLAERPGRPVLLRRPRGLARRRLRPRRAKQPPAPRPPQRSRFSLALAKLSARLQPLTSARQPPQQNPGFESSAGRPSGPAASSARGRSWARQPHQTPTYHPAAPSAPDWLLARRRSGAPAYAARAHNLPAAPCGRRERRPRRNQDRVEERHRVPRGHRVAVSGAARPSLGLCGRSAGL